MSNLAYILVKDGTFNVINSIQLFNKLPFEQYSIFTNVFNGDLINNVVLFMVFIYIVHNSL